MDRQRLWTDETPCGMEWVEMALSMEKKLKVQRLVIVMVITIKT